MNEKELLELKEEVEDELRKGQESKGQLKLLLSRLKEEFNCESVDEINNIITKTKKRLQKLEGKKQKKIKKIQELYRIT